MNRRWFVALLLCWSDLCVGQLTGHFYLQKEAYAPGEPVVLLFEVTNGGPVGQNIVQADPYSFCSGYQVHVSSDYDAKSTCEIAGWGGSCLSSYALLPPGKTRTERILLNYEHRVDEPGEYDVEAIRHLEYADANAEPFTAPKNDLEVRTQLHFRVDETAAPNLKTLQRFVTELQSPDMPVRLEAARTLASVGPRSLETTLLQFAENDELRRFAPLAFRKLNTTRSMAALAELLVKSKAGSYEHLESAKYLGESGDPRWFPLLAEVARHNARVSNYVAAAAQSGGSQAIPLLTELLRSPDKEFTVLNAASGLGYTGAREAIPILLGLLGSSDTGVAERALGSLQQLTHVSLGGDRFSSESPQSQSFRWIRWWAQAQTTARIYKVSECGQFSALP